MLRLHDVKHFLVDSDIKLFLRTQLTNIGYTQSNCNFTEDIDILCEKAVGLSIYASTLVKFIGSECHLPTERLALITSLSQSTIYERKSGIDLLYTKALEQAFCDMDLDEQEFYSHFQSIMGAVLLVFNPLQVKTLSALLRASDISITLHPLHSVPLFPDNETNPIQVFHKSFPNFLMDPG